MIIHSMVTLLSKFFSDNLNKSSNAKLYVVAAAYQLAYFFFDYLTLHIVHYVPPFHNLGFSTWEPMAGISICLIYVYGIPILPFVFVCPMLSEMIINNENIHHLTLLLSDATSSICYTVIVYLLRNRFAFDPTFRKNKDAVAFVLVSASITLINSFEHIVSIYLDGTLLSEYFFSAYWRHYVGELSGIISIVPLFLLLVYHRPLPKFTPQNGAQLFLLLLALLVIFGYPNASVFQLFYLLFLPAIWVALSSSSTTSAFVVLFVQLASLVGSEIKFGSDTGRGAVQSMIIALTFTVLLLSAVVAENEDASKRLRKQEMALNRALRLKMTGETAATIAHEINQPLTALRTYAEVAKKALSQKDLSLTENILNKLQSEVERTASIIKSIRGMLKKDKVVFTTFEIGDILDELDEILQNETSRVNSQLLINKYKTKIKVQGDKLQVQQAIMNLVANSAEALLSIQKKGVIQITIKEISTIECVIEIEDNGPGFETGYSAKERVPFISTKEDGTGIGLSIVESIVEIHGGSFEIQSNRFATIARIKLPIAI